MFQNFLFDSIDIKKSSYFWNALAGVLNALQSVLILIVVARVNGPYYAGIFSISYAIAILGLTMGTYGMRSFQVTDTRERADFSVYLAARVITSAGMLVLALGYCITGLYFKGYPMEKTLIVFVICFWKVSDSIEDVFHGNFQQKNRLDVGAKAICIRYAVGMICFILSIIIIKRMMAAAIICCISSWACFLLMTLPAQKHFGKVSFSFCKDVISELLLPCFPLFASGFLAIYLGNIPKYAIDSLMTEIDQACYNYIFMPVFVVSLLASFVYNPILADLAKAKDENRYETFRNIVFRQVRIVLILSVLCVIIGFAIGIPILSILYNISLIKYQVELVILLVGGGLLAFVSLFTVVITVLRKQQLIIWGYLATAILAKVFSGFAVEGYGLTGAALLFTIFVSVLAIYMGIVLVISTRKTFQI